MKVTLKSGGTLSFRASSGYVQTIGPGETADVPKDVAERHAHRFTFHDAPEAPEPKVAVVDSAGTRKTSAKPDDGKARRKKRRKKK